MTAIGLTVQSQNQANKEQTRARPFLSESFVSKNSSPSSEYVQGEITVKLKSGVGEFGKQTGMV